jgi:hypothetical protein
MHFWCRGGSFPSGLFFGVAGGAVVLAGYAPVLLRPTGAGPRLISTAFWGGYPILLALASIKLSSEVRYVFPLFSPFVATLGGRALAALAAAMRQRRASAIGAGILLVLACLAPPKVYVLDGPHSMWGRLWMPFLWHRWQDRVADNLHAVDALVEQAEHARVLVVLNSHFQDEMFLKERLIEAGFAVREPSAVFPGCTGFSAYWKQGHAVAQVRTHLQYSQVLTAPKRFSALMLKTALACPALMHADRAYVTAYGSTTRFTFAEATDPALWGPVLHRLPSETEMTEAFSVRSILNGTPWRAEQPTPDQPARLWEGKLRASRVTPADLVALRGSADRYLTRPIAGATDGPITTEQIRSAYRSRCRADGGGFPLAPRC